jgi:hypothetical protein
MCRPGPHREDEKSHPMMHGRGKSDSAIVAGKSTNKVACPAEEQSAVEQTAAQPVGGDQGECGLAKHALDTEPG